MPDTAIAPTAAPSPSQSPTPAPAEATPIVAPVAATAEAVTEPTAAEALATLDLTKYTDSQVKELESGDPERIGKVLKVAAPAVKAAETPAAKPAESTAAAESPVNGENLGRVSIKAMKPEDRAKTVQALELIRGGKAPSDAFAEVFGIQSAPVAAPSPAAKETSAAASVPQVHPKVAALESSLVELQAKYKEAKASYDPAKDDIYEQMTDVKMDLRDARREAAIDAERQAAHAITAAEWEAKQEQHRIAVMDKYSDLISDPDSGFIGHCDDELLLAEARKDPILLNPDWQEKIGQRVIEKFFKGKAANSAAPETPGSPIPPAPKNTVRLPGSPAGNGYSSGGPSLAAAEAEFNALPWEERIAALGQIEAGIARNRR